MFLNISFYFSWLSLICTYTLLNFFSGISISPLGFIRGDTEEAPTTLEFAKHFKGGALLSIVWSSGRFQHFPMFFMTSVQLGQDLALTAQCLSNTSPTVEFTTRIFSSPAI